MKFLPDIALVPRLLIPNRVNVSGFVRKADSKNV
jgi:hypothetical protein